MKRLSLSARRRAQCGAAAVELGLLFLPMAAITFGTTELGRAFHQYNTVAKNVRDGARFLATQTPGSTLAGRCLTLSGSNATNAGACSNAPLLPGLTLAQVTVCDATNCPADHQFQPTGSGVVNLVTVTVTGYTFTSMVPFVVPDIVFGPVSATMVQPI